MTIRVALRDITENDIPILFQQQLDPVANHVAAFGAKDPADRNAFFEKWKKIIADHSVTKKAILFEGKVAGNVLSFLAPWSGKQEVSYWLGREYWGKGIATSALAALLKEVTKRPLYARAAKDNVGSLRVLEKCGFRAYGADRGFANSRGEEVDEVLFELVACPYSATLDRVDELSEDEREEVRLLTEAVYPPEELADWQGQEIEWSKPEWCVRVQGEDRCLNSYVGVYVRHGNYNGREKVIGGIGNVKTHPKARGRGFAALGIQRAAEFFREKQDVDFALLVCEPNLLGYYNALGWKEFHGKLQIRQHGEACEFTLNKVMTLECQSDGVANGIIDLCGAPW